ncbi:MAG: 16S rRNA processing protein RimM [Fimbriimonadaceae bacterium]|nr:16S rRNA processing protein RimM [Fimbriimonadaceae bacterium]
MSKPNPGDLVPIGKIVGVHGIKGAMKVEPWTDFPERFEPGAVVHLRQVAYEVIATHWHKSQVRVILDGFEKPEDVQPHIGQALYADADEELELDEDEYEVRHLIGMAVRTSDGEALGSLEHVLPSPAQDLLCVGELMIPMAKEFVKKIDFENRCITVELIPGMRNEEVDDVS